MTLSAALSGPAGLNAAGPGALDQRLTLDVQGVDALRRTVRATPDEGMKQASRQFEVMFLQMMLKSMREAMPSEGLTGSSQEQTYTGMLDQQLSQNLSGRGLGLAEAMFSQLSRSLGGAEPASGAVPTASLSAGLDAGTGVGMRMGMGMGLGLGAIPLAAPAPKAAAWVPAGAAQPADLSLYQAATANASLSRSTLPQAHVEQFVSRLLPAAQQASRASGVPAQLIMAQAALESGWGRREIRADDGRSSHNLFGIKADRNWKGPVVEATTTEYVNGAAQKTRAAFRAYGSYQEAFADYARFLTGNPRYAGVLASASPAEAAHGLQRAGYATDPDYGGKLVRIMKQMG